MRLILSMFVFVAMSNYVYAGALTLQGVLPPGFSIQLTPQFIASKKIVPLCGSEDPWTSWRFNEDYKAETPIIAQAGSNGHYQISISLLTNVHVAGDIFNICQPKITIITAVISSQTGEVGQFYIDLNPNYSESNIPIDLAKVSQITSGSSYDSIDPPETDIPGFSDQANYKYDIDINVK